MGAKSGVTVGFRYYFGIHIGICRGAIDELVEIEVGGRTAWSGSVAANQTVNIDAPELFGGDAREGGIVGPLDVMMGEPDQALNPSLASMLGGLVPAFRGVTSLFFDGQVSALNPYPKPWKMRCRRALKGWEGDIPWNPATAIIDLQGGAIKAMNPAHIIYQCSTDRSWGRGLPPAKLDDAAFTSAAQTLFDEGFGLCLSWNRQDSIQNFIQAVLDHIGAAYYTDRITGLVTLKLIRSDYDPALLPLFTPDTGLLSIEEDESSAQGAATNELIVRYVNPIEDEQGQVRVQNTASITALGAKASRTVDYPGIPTSSLALRAGQRDLLASSGILKRFKVRLDRRGYKEQPGSVFRVSDPLRGIENIVLRAGRVDDSAPDDGVISVTTVEDVFSLADTSFVDGQVSNWVPPNLTPVPIAVSDLMEIPYRDLIRASDPATVDALPVTAGFVGALAQRPNGLSLGYEIATRLNPIDPYVRRGRGGFSPTATLAADLPIAAVMATLTAGVDLDQVQIGTSALIDDEIVRVDSLDISTGQVGLGRGCVDTIPAAHLSGARIWFFEDSDGADTTEYSETDNVDVKLLTATGAGILDEAAATADALVMDGRQNRPYAPGNFKINGMAYPTTEIQLLTVSWAHRDRVLQQDQLIDTLQGDIGPELQTFYTVRIFDGAALVREVNGIVGTVFNYTDEAADGGPFNPIRVTLHAKRDGIESWQVHDWTIPRDPAWVAGFFNLVSLLIGFEGSDGSTTIVDESSHNHVITVNGDAHIDTAAPLIGTSSGLFDGAGDYLNIPASNVFDLAGEDFTLELVVAFNSVATQQTFIAQWPGVGTAAWGADWRNTDNMARFFWTIDGSTVNQINASWTPTTGVRYHFAVCRNGPDLRLFIDGTQVGGTFNIGSATIFSSTADLFIGRLEFAGFERYANAFIDEIRLIKGLALYTEDFTPPSGPHPRS